MKEETLRNIIALSLIKGIGAATIKKSLLFVKAYANDWHKLAKFGAKVTASNLSENFKKAEEILLDCESSKIHLVSIIDEEYPQRLLQLKDPPPVLYYKGDLSLIHKAIGVVGTRNPSVLGDAIAKRLGTYFSDQWSVCNGLTGGIDQSVMLGEDGNIIQNAIGVLSSGLNYDRTASKATQDLASKILTNNGLILSEHAPNKLEEKYAWNKTIRIQAGISNAIILVQSSVGGESKHPIKAFSNLNRPLAVIAFPSNKEYLTNDLFGANRLILKQDKEGVMELCGIKKVSQVSIGSIIVIRNKEDYLKLENAVLKDLGMVQL